MLFEDKKNVICLYLDLLIITIKHTILKAESHCSQQILTEVYYYPLIDRRSKLISSIIKRCKVSIFHYLRICLEV